MADYTVAISSDFFSAFAALPKAKQGRVMDFMSKFRSNPMSPGMNYEKINDAADKNLRSVRVDDTYRAIVMRGEGSNVFLLLWVDHHDKAYEWARRKRCQINPTTGSVQVFDVDATEPIDQPSPEKPGLFANVSDEQLLALGVPGDQVNFVRSLVMEEDFYQVKNSLPEDAYEALEWIVNGCPENIV